MARQYDVEDLLNSDASDPDGEPTPIATNDDVRDGKIIVETADGTGKIGDVSQIVADYLKKSAGFFTEIRPYYIVRPATSQAWTGTWELFLHGIDDGGLSDAVNITIGINGVVVHTQAWTVSSGARDIEFSISPTESTALIATPPTGSYARCYVAFHDTDGNEIVIRHFSLKLLDAVPKIPEAEIPDSIARDDEVTAAIAAALAAHPGAFSASLELGNYENAAVGPIAGHYAREGSNTRVDISYRNSANEDKTTEIRNVQAGQGLVFNDSAIFVVEWTNEQASYREFNGFWAAGQIDSTAEGATISVKVIQHELRSIRFMTASQLKGLLPEVQTAVDKTVDIHLQERPGDFVNNADAAVAGISLIENTTANRTALDARTYNFAGLTWQVASVDIPDDGNEYWVVVRVARALGNIETQFQLLNDDPEEGTAHLFRSRQGDDTWHYYQVTADTESVWTLQRRATATHTRIDAPLGDVPVRQIQRAITEGLVEVQENIDTLFQRVGNIPLSSDVLWATSKTLPTRTTDATVDADWTFSDDVPDGVARPTGIRNPEDFIEIPKSIRGELHADLVNAADEIIQTRVVDLHAGLFTFKDFADNNLRIAVTTSSTDSTKWRLWIDNPDTLVLPAGSVMKIYGVTAFLSSDLNEDVRNLIARVDNIPISTKVLWATSKTLATSLTTNPGFLDADWTLSSDVPSGTVVSSISSIANDFIDFSEDLRGEIHVDFEDARGELLAHFTMDMEVGLETFTEFAGGTLRGFFTKERVGTNLIRFGIEITSAGTLPAGTVCKIYGVTALPSRQSQIVTMEQFQALEQRLTAVDNKFGGVPLNGPAAGSELAFINAINLNKYIPETNWATVPMFCGTVLRRDPPQFGTSTTHLAIYDKILIRITRYNGALQSAQRLESTDFFVNVEEWNSLKTVPFPDQSTAEDATRRIAIIASTKDNRALVHEFPQVPSRVWRDTLPATGNPTGDQLRAFETAAQKWVDDLRSGKKFVYIGKSNESNPRMLVGMSGTDQDFLIEAKGYH